MRKTGLWIALTCAACRAPTSPLSSAPDSERVEPRRQVSHQPPAPSVATVPPPPSTSPRQAPECSAATLESDLDGDGQSEAIALTFTGSLTVGAAAQQLELPDGLACEIWSRQTPKLLRSVDLDQREQEHELLVTLPKPTGEDANRVFFLFRYRAGSLIRLAEIHGGPGTDLEFSGDGSARRSQHPEEVCVWTEPRNGETPRLVQRWQPRHSIVYGLDRRGETLVEKGRHKLDLVDCHALPACPFVYLVAADGREHYLGEILRNLRGSELAGAQSLAVPLRYVAPGQTLRLRLRELKPEVTFLSESWLVANGRVMMPRVGGGEHVLRRGDVIDLEFDLGADVGQVELWTKGYYVPDRGVAGPRGRPCPLRLRVAAPPSEEPQEPAATPG